MSNIKLIDRVHSYDGGIIDVFTDEVEVKPGLIEKWDYVSHRLDAAAIVPVKDDGKIIFVKQFRYCIDKETIEIPAGGRNSIDESFYDCAMRELEEETGYKTDKLEPLLSLKSAPAYDDEHIEIYLARDLTPGQMHLDPSEDITLIEMTIDEAVSMVLDHKIEDAKTISAILAAKIVLDS